MRWCCCVFGLMACGPRTLEDLSEEVDVEALAFDIDPADEGPPPQAVWELDAAREPVLGFQAWGLFDLEQVGVWTRYNVRVAQRGDGPESFDIRFVAENDSIETGVSALDEHIRTPDFLDVPKHPLATFASSMVATAGDAFEVTGEMTLRGTSKEMTYTATIESDDAVHTTATIEFSRWDFGLYAEDITEPGGDRAQDRVVVTYDVWLKRAE